MITFKITLPSRNGKTDRSIKYEYDQFDRIIKVDYGNGEVATFQYDSWGKLIASSRGKRKAAFVCDYFGRLVKKTDGAVETRYLYNRYGQRTDRQLKNGSLMLTEFKTYDRFGRLIEIKSGDKIVKYLYNAKNQLSAQVIDGVPIEFTYTKYGQLESKTLGGKAAPVATLKYFYGKDGMIVGRVVDGKHQMYSYDKRGQLLQVADMQGNVAEKYVYDPAGNILSKTIDGKTTTFIYDKANQLVSSTCDGKVTKYQYDAAGRLIQEGDKSYEYGWLDKVLAVRENGKQIASFDYQVDGQIAQAVHGGKSENFLWDNLALIHRGETSFINEPYVTGGNPILSSKQGAMFNDMLGTTLGTKQEKFKSVQMTAFGETKDAKALFTGKPYIGELGYAFLFRNYRTDKGKWQTADPLGYPDGWNNLAYCGNHSNMAIDTNGALWSWATGVVGAGLSVAGYVTSSLLTESDITTAGIAGAVAGGFVAGAVAGAMIGDPSAATMSALMLAGATSGAAGQLVNNAVSTTLDPNKQYNYATLTDGVLRNGVVGALTGILPLNDILAGIVAFETGVLDNLYAYSKEIILNALEQLNQNAKNRLMQQEKLME